MFPDYSLNNVNCSTKIYHNGKKFQIDLFDLSVRNWGFSTQMCKWRMMYYDANKRFSAYVFNNGRINVFCKTTDLETIIGYVEEFVGIKNGVDGIVIEATIVNIVLHFEMAKEINIDLNFTNGTSDDIFDVGQYDEREQMDVKILDKQNHSGLRITPFSDTSNMGITVYAAGKITAYGMTNEDDIAQIIDYIKNNIIL